MRSLPRLLVACFLLAFTMGTTAAAAIHVPADQPTIQGGINAAAIGDTVVVACGTYFESFIVMKSGVVLRSATGDPSCVIVDAQQNNRVFHCQDTNAATRIEGFTIQGGFSSASGGLWCVFSEMTIANCVFRNNEVTHDSAAIGIAQASPHIIDCVFLDNKTSDAGALRSHNRGGAIYIWNDSFPIIERCYFEGNSAFLGGAIWCKLASPTIRDCVFRNNTSLEGGGVSIESSPFVLERCVFDGNSATEGGGLYLNAASGVVDQCTFYGNSAISGGQILVKGGTMPTVSHSIVAFGSGGGSIECSAATTAVECSDVFGNVGGDWIGCLVGQLGSAGNFAADPLFCDAGSGVFTIRSNSPCAPPGATGCGLVGALGLGCGPVSIEEMSWASIKSRYRQ